MDIARIHHGGDLSEIAGDFILCSFLSPYSYMLNPIENAFSKIKTIVRSRLDSFKMNFVNSNN
jgi:transposase